MRQKGEMAQLHDRGHLMECQILDNEASKDYRHAITHDWKATYQLVPPDVHRANAAERAMRGIAIGRKAWLFAGSDRGGQRAGARVHLSHCRSGDKLRSTVSVSVY